MHWNISVDRHETPTWSWNQYERASILYEVTPRTQKVLYKMPGAIWVRAGFYDHLQSNKGSKDKLSLREGEDD